jgi:hypothetical protein
LFERAKPQKVYRVRQLAPKGGKPNNMKYLAMLVLTAVAFSLGACAHKSEATTTTSSTTSSGYSK